MNVKLWKIKEQNICKQITDKRTLRHLKKRYWSRSNRSICVCNPKCLTKKKEKKNNWWWNYIEHKMYEKKNTNERQCHGSFGRNIVTTMEVLPPNNALRVKILLLAWGKCSKYLHDIFFRWFFFSSFSLCAKVAFISPTFCNLRDVVPLFFFTAHELLTTSFSYTLYI